MQNGILFLEKQREWGNYMENIIWLILFFLWLPLLWGHWKKWKWFCDMAGTRKKKYKKLYRNLAMKVVMAIIVCVECLIMAIVRK